MIMTVKDADKPEAVGVAKRFEKLGYKIYRFDYTNNETVKTKIGGKEEEIYVPFAAISGMVLDDSFSNVKVTKMCIRDRVCIAQKIRCIVTDAVKTGQFIFRVNAVRGISDI